MSELVMRLERLAAWHEKEVSDYVTVQGQWLIAHMRFHIGAAKDIRAAIAELNGLADEIAQSGGVNTP